MRELAIVEAVAAYFDKKTTHVVTELPFLQRHVDIVAYEPISGLLIATEAKVKNWRIAIRQAITCLLFANEVYIAMPTKFIHRVMQPTLAKFGIGLLEVNSNVDVVVEPKKSRYVTKYHRDWVIDQVRRLERDHRRG